MQKKIKSKTNDINNIHKDFKNKYENGNILTLEDVVNVIGSEKNKEEYIKYNNLKGSKSNIINKLQRICIFQVVDIDRYKIIRIRETPISNKSLRILKHKNDNEILYYLTIFLNRILDKEFQKSGDRTLNVMLLDLAFSANLVNDNYKTIKLNQQEVAEYYNTKEEYVYDFIESSNYIIKHNIEEAIAILEDYNIITVSKNRKIVKNYKEFIDKNTAQEYDEITWATDEENEIINNIIDELFKEYDKICSKDNPTHKFTLRDFYFGKYSNEINVKLHKKLEKYNIVRFYNGYGLTILISGYMKTLAKELPDGNKDIKVLSKKMNDLVIEKVCESMENKNKNKLIDVDELEEIYTGLTVFETAKKLGKVSLNYRSQYKLANKMGIACEKKKATKVKTIENVKIIDQTKNK